MDDRIQELSDRLAELTDDELEELRGLVLGGLDETKEPNPDERIGEAELDELESLAAAATSVKKERKRRDERVTRGKTARETLESLRSGQDGDGTVVPEDRRPRVYGGGARAVTASGLPVHDADELTREFLTALRTYQVSPNVAGRIRVATVHTDRPSERTLRQSDSVEAVTAALDAAAAEHRQRALTAAGGLAAPEQPDYALPGFESVVRPVRGALPSFNAQRGGIRFIRPPELTDADDAVGVWTVQDDVSAVDDPNVRKSSLRVTPNSEIIVDVQAVTKILTFGNLTQRAYPEWMQRVIDLATAAHARIAEEQLLTQIGSLSTSVSGASGEGGDLGATRVLLPLLDRAATGMRHRLRTGDDAPLQLILPHWARGILRTDLALQEPGDARVGTTDADVVGYLSTRSLVPTWALDGETGQRFDAQADSAPVNAWPTEVVSYMFPAGSFHFIDGGTLDLGLVRDSELNAANDVQVFTETFETVAFRGGEAFRIAQAVTPSGVSRAAK